MQAKVWTILGMPLRRAAPQEKGSALNGPDARRAQASPAAGVALPYCSVSTLEKRPARSISFTAAWEFTPSP
jgi:hypothetical protein